MEGLGHLLLVKYPTVRYWTNFGLISGDDFSSSSGSSFYHDKEPIKALDL